MSELEKIDELKALEKLLERWIREKTASPSAIQILRELIEKMRKDKESPKLDASYFRSFRLGKLYFRFIKGTELEGLGWTSEKLAHVLVESGFIQILRPQPREVDGRFGKAETRYVELPGKALSKRELLTMLKKGSL